MKGDVRTLATVAKSRVSAYSMAVVFSALIYIVGVLLAVMISVHRSDEIDVRMGQKRDLAGLLELST